MEKIKGLLPKLKHFINYLYYFNSSIIKNSFPYKLIGERISQSPDEATIYYKILGQQIIKDISLPVLLNDKKLIERFHPVDAARLGSIALENIINELPQNQRKDKFIKIRSIMLNSIHDFYPNRDPSQLILANIYPKMYNDIPDFLDSIVSENIYPCKLVGGKLSSAKFGTIVIFTILGKRDGHEKNLNELINDKKLLAKFHPTEAIKLGFISSGEILFELVKQMHH